jgi:hypothetical protein
MSLHRLACLVAIALALVGCSTVRKIIGVSDPGDPSVTIKSAETRWLLIKNPRFGDVASEPEFVWVEEDKVPTTFKTLLRGQSAIIAPPEIVARYGSPPGGGKISPRQGMPYQVAEPRAPEKSTRPVPAAAGARPGAPVPAPVVESPRRGFVVYVDTTRIVIDLTSADGLKTGSLISLRRDKIPIVHPVTGETLGELDEEVGTARITELRDRFSVAEIQTVAPGSAIHVKDRVVPK